MSAAGKETFYDQLPDYPGCKPDCPAGQQLLEDLRVSVAADARNRALAQEMNDETAQYRAENPCEFATSGRCRLVEYLSGTAIAYRIILDAIETPIEKLIGE